MVDAFTTRNRLTQQTVGGNIDLWGAELNAQLGLADVSLDGVLAFTLSAGKVLTIENGVADESRYRTLWITGGTGGTVTVPALDKAYHVVNDATGSVTFSAGGTTAIYPAGTTGTLIVRGSSCRRLAPQGRWTTIASLTTTSGTTAVFNAANFPDGGDYWNEIMIAFEGVSHSSGSSSALRISLSDSYTHSVFQTLGTFAASATVYGELTLRGHNPNGNGTGAATGGSLSGAVADMSTSGVLAASTPLIYPWRGATLKGIQIDFNGSTFDAGTIKLRGRG